MSRHQRPSRGTTGLRKRALGIGAALIASITPVQMAHAEDTGATAETSSAAVTPAAGTVDAATRKELLEAEARLAAAIEKRDVAVLDELLAEYYADSRNRAKRAYNKRGTLARCRDGQLPAYPLEPGAQLTRSGDVITIEGRAKRTGVELSDAGEVVAVRHLWTKKDGRWLLIAQVIG